MGDGAWPLTCWRSIRARPRAAPSSFAGISPSRASRNRSSPQHYPRSGWVEHDAEDIWRTVVATARGAIASAGASPREIACIGITNQRETTVVWDRATGRPIHNAIVWQDRRTADVCRELKAAGHDRAVAAKTGLELDPYFSATKIAWILDEVAGARAAAENGALAFGTIDSFLLWRLTGGRVHATDATNASRTSLLDIHTRPMGREPARPLPRSARAAARGARLRGTPSARRMPRFWARPFPSQASRATSRRPPSARPASSPA